MAHCGVASGGVLLSCALSLLGRKAECQLPLATEAMIGDEGNGVLSHCALSHFGQEAKRKLPAALLAGAERGKERDGVCYPCSEPSRPRGPV